MNAHDLRSQHEQDMLESLLRQPDVARVNEALARDGKGNIGVRRRLLSTSVRLSAKMAPTIRDITRHCASTLGIEIPIELYVFPSPQFNAACVKPEDGRLFVMFSSSLLEAFRDAELCFVMGHELGHHLFRHHDLPIGYILRGSTRPNPRLALELTAWSRYAEISADRAGAHCARDFTAVSHALFKLASGLSGDLVQFTLEEFLAQVDEMQLEDAEPGQGAPTEDWFLTHPFSPLRVKALKLFDESELARPGATPRTELEVAVQGLLGLMEPSYLEGRTQTAETMRRLLFAGAIAVAAASDGISDEEIEVFERFFGTGSFTDKLDVAKITQELPARIAQTKKDAAAPQRMQIVSDLCAVARASGKVTEVEQRVLKDIAADLDLPTTFVDQSLAADPELD